MSLYFRSDIHGVEGIENNILARCDMKLTLRIDMTHTHTTHTHIHIYVCMCVCVLARQFIEPGPFKSMIPKESNYFPYMNYF